MLKPLIGDAPATKRQFDAAIAALRGLHQIQGTAHLLTLDGEQTDFTLPPIAPATAGGVPSAIVANQAGLQATVTFVDPDRKMKHLEGVHIRHFLLRCYYLWQVDEIQATAKQVVFTGGCYRCVRDGPLVTIYAAGKMFLANHNPEKPYLVPKGTNIVEGIKRLMEQGGDSRAHMDFQSNDRELRDDFWVGSQGNEVVVGEGGTWTKRAKDLAEQIDFILYERQDGALIGKKHPKSPQDFIFADDLGTGEQNPHGFVVTMKVDRDFTGFANRAVARWGKDLAEDPVIIESADKNPLSKQSLHRGIADCPITLYKEYPDARKRSEVVQHLHDALQRSQVVVTQVQATCHAFPFLEYGDLYRFSTQDYSGVTTIGSWTLPLAGGADMTLGWVDFDVSGRT